MKVRTRCNSIQEVYRLTKGEKLLGMIHCPLPCETCGKPHGYEPFREVALKARKVGGEIDAKV